MTLSTQRTAAPHLFAIFALGAIVCVFASVFVGGAALGVLGIVTPRLGTFVIALAMCLGLLALTHRVLRRSGRSLADLGFAMNRKRLRQFGLGFAIGVALFLGVVAAQSAMVGARWELTGSSGALGAIVALGFSFVLVLAEELLFRGVELRQLRIMYGDPGAILLSASLFGAYHLLQAPGYWGIGAVFVFLMPLLGGLVFGFAAVKSDGLALPIGLHLGGNWVQSAVAGFAPIGGEASASIWRIPVSASDVQVLTAPDVLPRLPYLVAVAVAAISVWMVTRPSTGGARSA
jgi:membrane protease YdiL (CAAX protease family)